MLVWIDAQLPPALAQWIRESFGIEARAVRESRLLEAEDSEVFARARRARAVVFTKDSDFVELLARLGPPPQVVWLTCGNTSNAFLREILGATWPRTPHCSKAENRWSKSADRLVERTDGTRMAWWAAPWVRQAGVNRPGTGTAQRCAARGGRCRWMRMATNADVNDCRRIGADPKRTKFCKRRSAL